MSYCINVILRRKNRKKEIERHSIYCINVILYNYIQSPAAALIRNDILQETTEATLLNMMGGYHYEIHSYLQRFHTGYGP